MSHRFGLSADAVRSLAVGLIATCVWGCALFEVGEQQQLDREIIRLRGTVETAGPLQGTLVVVLIAKSTGEGEDHIVDHYVVERSGGRFQFFTTGAGRYALAAFNDQDSDFLYERDEPVLVPDPQRTFDLSKGDSVDGLRIIVDPDARAAPNQPISILEFESRSVHEQFTATLGQISSVGELAEISDPRFAPEVGAKGLWKPYDFIFEVGAGVFFLEAYDPDRIPVLFVHGILGFPSQFEALIDSLDHTRFQPWVYLYPSGAKLKNVGRHLSQVVIQLEAKHGFERIVYVAHSMGGLVTRSFLLDYFEQTRKTHPREFITISTPWGGQASAALGAQRLPNPVYSWIDISPGSVFLRSLFFRGEEGSARQMLPPGTDSNLLFGFHGKARGGPIFDLFDPTAAAANDGVVTVASQLRQEAQHDAQSIWGVDATHTGILTDPSTIDRLGSLLGRYADER